MRPSILPNLIDAAARNEARGLADPALFEVGPQYKDATPDRPAHGGGRHAPQHGGAAQLGGPGRAPSTPSTPRPMRWPCWPPSARRSTTCRPSAGAPDWYHPGRSGAIKLGDRVMAHFGELHPEIVADADLKGPVAAFEVFLDAPPLPKAKADQGAAASSCCRPSSRSSATSPSWSMPAVEAEKLVRAARNADKALITGARVFDLYAGKGVPEGKKSLAIAVTLQPVERTLTDAEIEAVSTRSWRSRQGNRRVLRG